MHISIKIRKNYNGYKEKDNVRSSQKGKTRWWQKTEKEE